MAFPISYNPDRSGLAWARFAPAPPAVRPVAATTAVPPVASARGRSADLASPGAHFLDLVHQEARSRAQGPASGGLAWSEHSTRGQGLALDVEALQAAQNPRLSAGRQTYHRHANPVAHAVSGTALREDQATGLKGFLGSASRTPSGQPSETRRSAFTMSVEQIAAAAKSRSGPYTPASGQGQTGHILISVDGGSYLIPVSQALNLAQVPDTVKQPQVPADMSSTTEGEWAAITRHLPDLAPGAAPQTGAGVGFEGARQLPNVVEPSHARSGSDVQRLLQDQVINLETRKNPGAANAPYAHKTYRNEATREPSRLPPTPSAERTSQLVAQRDVRIFGDPDSPASPTKRAAAAPPGLPPSLATQGHRGEPRAPDAVEQGPPAPLVPAAAKFRPYGPHSPRYDKGSPGLTAPRT